MEFIQPVSRSLLPKVSAVRAFSEQILPYWLAASVTALVSVFYAKIFFWSEQIAFTWAASYPLLAFLFIPSAMLISTAMAVYISPLASGSGIPQLIAALEVSRERNSLLDGLLGVPMILVKIIASCLCVLGGGVTGREGPMLQVSAGIFYFVHNKWPQMKSKLSLQSMILAGGAAGLASAFNTPLGGIVFAIEELAKVHISRIRTYIFHSVVIAGLLAQAILGNYLYLSKITVTMGAINEALLIGLAAMMIGALGALFSSGLVKVLDWRSKLKAHNKWLMTAACGLIVACIFYFFGQDAIGSGRGVIVDLLTHSEQPVSFSLGFVRGFANFFTYAGGVVGGIFAPALSTGAAFGAWASQLLSDSHSQLWILAGMVAFLTGLTRTPFTSLILVLEMTDSHNVIIILMLAAILAQGAAKLVDPLSFYEQMSLRIIKAHEEKTGIKFEHKHQ